MAEEAGMTKKEQAAQDAALDKLFKVQANPKPSPPKVRGKKK